MEQHAVRYDSGGNCVMEHLAVRCNSGDLIVLWNILRYAATVATCNVLWNILWYAAIVMT